MWTGGKIDCFGVQKWSLDFLAFMPPLFFFLFILVGTFFLNKLPVIMALVWRKCRWVVEQDFHENFQINFFMFFHIFLWPIGVLFEGSPLPPNPPCTSCQSATLPMNIKTFYLTSVTRCGWVRITVLTNFFCSLWGEGVSVHRLTILR